MKFTWMIIIASLVVFGVALNPFDGLPAATHTAGTEVPEVTTADTTKQMLKGTVTDMITEEALVGVKVTLQGSDSTATSSATSNEDGHYSIANLEAGTYTIKVNHDGYEKYSKVVEIKEEDLTWNIKLNPSQ